MTNFTLAIDSDGIALVTWDMPGRSMNVLNAEVMEELSALVEKVAADAAIKGAVITSGKDAFCAGADLTLLERMSAVYADMLRKQGEQAAAQYVFDESRKASQLFRRLETSGKPWVAALNGTAMGGAFELALACHYRVAADNPKTRLGLPEVKVGLFPGAGGTQRVARMLPARRRAAIPAQGRCTEGRSRQGDEADRRRGAGRRHDQDGEGLDQGRRQGGQAVGRERFPAAGRRGLFQGRHDDLSGGERHLPARNL